MLKISHRKGRVKCSGSERQGAGVFCGGARQSKYLRSGRMWLSRDNYVQACRKVACRGHFHCSCGFSRIATTWQPPFPFLGNPLHTAAWGATLFSRAILGLLAEECATSCISAQTLWPPHAVFLQRPGLYERLMVPRPERESMLGELNHYQSFVRFRHYCSFFPSHAERSTAVASVFLAYYCCLLLGNWADQYTPSVKGSPCSPGMNPPWSRHTLNHGLGATALTFRAAAQVPVSDWRSAIQRRVRSERISAIHQEFCNEMEKTKLAYCVAQQIIRMPKVAKGCQILPF